ncbi:MAG: protease modulator HflK [Porticoccaceae bacterium]|nr:MAG: protease modulator HflK [Porticoccaceae bacterium]
MAWNEPGGGRDPWGGGPAAPPDLGELLERLRQRFGRFGGGGAGPWLLLAGALLAGWVLFGFYQVDEKERAVVLRFGKFHDVVGPGLHWNPPLVDQVIVEAVTAERQYRNRQNDLMLTADENIVDVQISVQYNIKDVVDYVLRVRDPEMSLRHASDSALRHVVGSSTLDAVISSGRAQIGEEVKERLQTYLDKYRTGINVVRVNILEAKPPAAVKEAYDDVIKAREDQERVINEAQSYANAVIPEARGRAQRILEEAEAYRARVVAEAEGEAERFRKLLAAYREAPEVTRERLYIEALEAVLTRTTKVLVTDRGDNVLMLPLAAAAEESGRPAAGQLSPAQLATLAELIADRIRSGNERRELRR